jgi:class 3 adenylate cyclase
LRRRSTHRPEELNRIECARLAVAERIAREEGGTPVRPQPGRLFVVFGYPRARENDARRAIRAVRRIALEVATGADGGNRRIRTGARIGVHSGLGVVRLEGPRGDDRDWCHVVGAPLRIASRLEERASAGEILVTESTRVLLHEDPGWDAAGLFTFGYSVWNSCIACHATRFTIATN